MVRKLAVILAVVMVSSLAWTAPAAAYEPKAGGTFNVPKPWGTQNERYRIIKHVEKAIRQVPRWVEGDARPQPVILISTYLLNRRHSVEALIDACRRGVSVRVILDADIDNARSKRLIQTLNADNVDGPTDKPKSGPCNTKLPPPDEGPLRRGAVTTEERDVPLLTDRQARLSVRAPTGNDVTWGSDRSYAKKCNGSCRGAGGNMHSKFYAFTRTGTASNVVMMSSSNLNRGGALNGWNDLYTMKGRPVSYAKYNQIHREMTADTRAGDDKEEIKDGPYLSRFFPMRNASKRNDPVMQDLNKVGCRSGFGRTKIYVSMFYWKGTRGEYIANKLLSLARNGCDVNIIYGAPSIDIATKLREAAKRRQIDLWDSRWDHNNDGYNEVRTHAKYVLVKGRFAGKPKAFEVWTGSANWVAGSLSRGDENTLNVSLRSAYRQYIANWNKIKRHSRRLPYSIYR